MARLPKKPKLRKFPKAPKSKSADVLKNYVARCKEVQKDNDAKMAEYRKKVTAINSARKKVQSLKDQAKRIKSKRY